MDQLTSSDLEAVSEPFALFREWFSEAARKELNDPEAMALATVDAAGLPDVRMVLLKDWSEEGFVFYTNAESAKGTQLASNMRAAALFHWKSLRRQVRLRGPVEPVSEAAADAYFASRPRDSRIGAWASQQSRPLESRFALEKAVAAVTARYPVGAVPRPPYWSGFRLAPLEIEFWQNGAFRLHDRVRFVKGADGAWEKSRLYP